MTPTEFFMSEDFIDNHLSRKRCVVPAVITYHSAAAAGNAKPRLRHVVWQPVH